MSSEERARHQGLDPAETEIVMEGVRAFGKGIRIDANPYDGRRMPTYHHLWDYGWSVACEDSYK